MTTPVDGSHFENPSLTLSMTVPKTSKAIAPARRTQPMIPPHFLSHGRLRAALCSYPLP